MRLGRYCTGSPLSGELAAAAVWSPPLLAPEWRRRCDDRRFLSERPRSKHNDTDSCWVRI
jgi:hypothetical protein